MAGTSHEAAKFACERWHYSGCLPSGKLVKYGVWESSEFIGVVIFSRGASPYLGEKFNLKQTECVELTRVALTNHESTVSSIVAKTIKLLKENNPKCRLVVSFADPEQGHLGGIYQAGNWIYSGRSNSTVENFVRGKWRHVRGSYHETKGTTAPQRVRQGKHRYLYPLDKAMRRKIEPLRIPHPRSQSRDATLSSVEGLVQSQEGALK